MALLEELRDLVEKFDLYPGLSISDLENMHARELKEIREGYEAEKEALNAELSRLSFVSRSNIVSFISFFVAYL